MIGKKYEPRKTYIDGKEFNAQEFSLAQIIKLTPGIMSWFRCSQRLQKPLVRWLLSVLLMAT
jgi:hypothetical protein